MESKLVSKFCEDENGALIYNHIPNGQWNSINGLGLNRINGRYVNGYNSFESNGFDNTGNGKKHEGENENQRETSKRARGDAFTLPINSDPLPLQVILENSFVCFTYSILLIFNHVII